MDVIKLYKKENGELLYWEAWENEGKIIIHHGRVGEDGDTEDFKATKASRERVSGLEKQKLESGYAPVPEESMAVLVIEYKNTGMADSADLENWQELESQMDDTLGWTGLGHCEGVSTGNGIIEVSNLVVDFEIARKVIAEDLKGTEFGAYSRIYKGEE